MREKVNPKDYGLSSKTTLIKTGENTFSIVIDRKSRIIMKDATAIQAKRETIRQYAPEASVMLETTAPVCSKSLLFLNENGIHVGPFTNNPG